VRIKKNKQRGAKKICRGKKIAHALKMLECKEEANKRNEARKFYTIAVE
jgi:hypothetical protein